MVGHVKKVILENFIKKLSLDLLRYCEFCMQKKPTQPTNQRHIRQQHFSRTEIRAGMLSLLYQ